MSTETQCVRCGRPMADQAYADAHCAQELAETLIVAAGHADDAEAVLARQTRYGGGGRGGTSNPTPGDLTAAGKLAPIALAIGGWARIVIEETGRVPHWRAVIGPLCPPTGLRCIHGSCEAVRRREPPSAIAVDAGWLATEVDWLRKHPAAAEAFAELHDACAQLARLVDRPADKELVGMCDCGRVLYATHGKSVVICPTVTCKLHWNVAESRDILRRSLDGKLVTAAEAARLSGFLDTDRTQVQIRKLINAWASRGELVVHPLATSDEPAFRFGDIVDRLARAQPRRTREAA